MSIKYKNSDILSVSNVAGMFLLKVNDNQLVQTLGYTTEGIGANLYRYDASSTATIDGGFVQPGIGGTLSFSGSTFNGTSGTGRFIAVDQSKIIPSRFGVVGAADDTNTLLRCVNALADGATIFLDKNQTYLLDDNGAAYATLTFSGLSNIQIEGNGATIKAKNGMSADNGTNLLYFVTCDHVMIRNLIVDGNRDNRSPSGEKTTYNLNFEDCDYFTLENVASINSCIDGFYLNSTDIDDPTTYCTNFVMTNCHANNNWRQGMSIINAYNVSVIGGEFTNTNGTAPQAGIDIEANSATSTSGEKVNKSIHIKGARFYGNAGTGIVCSAQNQAGITIEGCEFYDNDGGACDISSQTTFTSNYVHGHSASSLNALVQVSASTYANGSIISKNRFESNSVAKPCIYTHSVASGIVISDNTANDCDYFLNAWASTCYVAGNHMNDPRNTGIGFASTTSTNTTYVGNTCKNWIGRAMYIEGSPVIEGNHFLDGSSIGFAALDCQGGVVLARGNFITNTSSTAGLAVRSASGVTVIFDGNYVSNFSTDWASPNSGILVISHTGSGSPETVLSSSIGSRFYRTNGGTSTVMYVKETGTGNTGWVAK